MEMEEDLSGVVIAGLLAGGTFQCRARNATARDVFDAVAHELQQLAARPPVVSIVGGAASGKSTFARGLAASTRGHVEILSTDDFVIGTRRYRREHLGEDEPLRKYNFTLLDSKVRELRALQGGEERVDVPVYRRENGAGVPPDGLAAAGEYSARAIAGPVDLLIIEGDFQPLAAPDLLLYLHVPDALRLAHRLRRDVGSAGYRDEAAVRASFALRQSSQHRLYTLPVAANADWLLLAKVPGGSDTPYVYDVYCRHAQGDRA